MSDKQPNNHASNCVLSGRCKLANSDACNRNCPAFIAMHGHSGKGGRIANANTPADYRLLTLANSPAREGQAKVYRIVDKIAESYDRQFEDVFEERVNDLIEKGEARGEAERNARIKSIYLWSTNSGTHKTTTAIAAMNEFIIANYLGSLKRNRQADQQAAYFLDVTELQELFNGFNRHGVSREITEPISIEYYRIIAKAKKAPMTVFDDLGIRGVTDAFRGDLHALINHRYANALPSIYTSNYPLKEMAQKLDGRLYDRIRDFCVELHHEGESKRGKR
jgi:DNA replication protein DnaC